MFELHRGMRIVGAMTVMLFAAGCGGGGDAGGEAAGDGDGGEAAAPMESPVDASTAGNISGSISFDGEAPAMEPIDMSAEPTCAEMHDQQPMTQSVLVGPDGGLANVFVYVREGLGDLEFPTPQQGVEIDQQGCRYIPHVLGVQTGQTLVIRNSDGILHNINAQPQQNRGFNISQPVNMTSERSFPIQEVMIPLRCDVHGWMNAYLGVMEHPYFAVSSQDGSFDLSTLPPGDYVLEAWHERYGTQTADVTVATGETAQVEFTFSEAMAENADVPLAEPIDLHDHEAMQAPAATE
ncbi:MAG: carboxypeptidase regulatory-like domain-containing protein [Longimicrobiales bacterium]|nr:carboxypeptidase regulatory-like domain-containing protein [Longimicrobiales bacterium]